MRQAGLAGEDWEALYHSPFSINKFLKAGISRIASSGMETINSQAP
ncbi:MAG: hypothetical protein ACOYYU_04745 [Chloroflexota bacterium]